MQYVEEQKVGKEIEQLSKIYCSLNKFDSWKGDRALDRICGGV